VTQGVHDPISERSGELGKMRATVMAPIHAFEEAKRGFSTPEHVSFSDNRAVSWLAVEQSAATFAVVQQDDHPVVALHHNGVEIVEIAVFHMQGRIDVPADGHVLFVRDDTSDFVAFLANLKLERI